MEIFSDIEYKEKIEQLKTIGEDYGCSISYFTDPDFKNGLIGWCEDNGKPRAVYLESKCIEDLVSDHNLTYEEAEDYFYSNTVRSNQYYNHGNQTTPLILYEFQY